MSEVRILALHSSDQFTAWKRVCFFVLELGEEEQRHQINVKPLALLQPPATSGKTTQAKYSTAKK